MSYPNSYDNLTHVNPGDLITDTHENAQADAINGIESTLGLTPYGPYPTVAAAIAGKADITGIQSEAYTYAADTGSANTYALALSPAPASYTAGMAVIFKAANTNTGASTLNVNSLGAKSLVKNGSAALAAGDISSGQIVVAIYDGTNFQTGSIAGLTFPLTVAQGGTGVTSISGIVKGNGTSAFTAATHNVDFESPADAQNQAAVYAADSGSANAYAVTLSPAPGAYAAGQVVSFKVAHSNTGASTLNVNALGTQTIVKYGSTTLAAGDLIAGEIVTVMYDGTNFQLMSPAIVPVLEGGTGATTMSGARTNLGAAASGINGDITSLTGLSTPLSVAQGGTGAGTISGLVKGNGTSGFTAATHNVDFESPADAQNQAAVYAADSGSANAYAVTLSPAPGAYAAGQVVSFKVAHTNTGNSTLSVNAQATQTILKYGSVTLAAGDLIAGEIVTVMYDGTNFQLMSPAIVPLTEGGTGATTQSGARSALGAAASGANSDITSLSALGTPLSAGQGGTGQSTYAKGDLLVGTSGSIARHTVGSDGTVLIADSTQTDGVRWGAVTVAPVNIFLARNFI